MVPLSSAFVGSYVAVRAIAFFIGGFPDPVDFASQEAEPGRSIYTGIIVFLGGIAAYNQWRYDRVLSFPLLLIAPRRSKSDLETLTTFMRCAPFANRRL
mmetsp:Transcript_9613/g.41392  ORF Transcript_9613/g.41392 Transcript_9613/m.41392 type:complete len:99 (+) Transcript_9613:714-1010(+)